MYSDRGSTAVRRTGFPHSEIPGSKLVCSSPGLIAAYRVLHRLLAPRHSPYALSSLTTSVSSSRDAVTFRPKPEATCACVSSFLLHTAMCVFRKELPFAGYSVVKDPRCRLSARRMNFSFYCASRLSQARARRFAKRRSAVLPDPGGEYRARTGDLLVANQALSQLS